MNDKARIRNELLEKRRKLTEEQVKSGSFCVFSRLLALEELQSARSVFCYLSFQNEVDTRRILEYCRDAGKTIFVPVVRGREMLAVRWQAGNTIKNAFGIEEPANWREEPAVIDLTLVPGVAFGRNKARIGHGGGYYDRFMAANDSCFIGLAYDFQILDELPEEAWDRRMDKVVFPGGMLV